MDESFLQIALDHRLAETGVSGILAGVLFEADLGPSTAEKAGAMTKFDPGKGWSAVPTK